MNTPSSSINSQENFFKEEILPQKFQVKRNPQGIRLINGSDKFIDKDGKEREINPAHLHHFGDKIVIETNDTIYTNIDGSDRFEDIVPQSWQESTKVRQYDAFNREVFEKYGDIIFSRYIPRIDGGPGKYEFIINSKEYTANNKVENNKAEFPDLGRNYSVKIIDDKIYVIGGNKTQVLNASQKNLILLSEENRASGDTISFGSNGDVLKESINNPTLGQKYIKYLQVNNKKWKNSVIGGNDAQVKYNAKHIRMNGPQELVIDDTKYNLDDKKGYIGKQCEVSEDGNMVAIEFDYNEERKFGESNKEVKEGKYILIGDKNGIQKEIKLGSGRIQKIALDNEGQLAYVTKNGITKKTMLHMNEFEYELDVKDNSDAIKELSFIDKNTVHIKYINTGDELVEKHISLNEDAEQVKQKLEAEQQEAKNASEMKNWLASNNITSVTQLLKIVDDAKKVEGLEDVINSMVQDLQKVKLENKSLKEDNTTLTTAKETAEKKNTVLEKNMATIKSGINKATFNYAITPEVKAILSIK